MEKEWITTLRSFLTDSWSFLTSLSPILTVLMPLCVKDYFNNRRFDKEFFRQKKNQDAKENLPVLLELVEDLETLHQAFVFNGSFCPPIEPICPSLSKENGEGSTMSYAQRGYQFRSIGARIIKNCRKIAFQTRSDYLPKTLKTIEELITFLNSNGGEEKKTPLDFMITELVSYLANENMDKDAKQKAEDSFKEFYTRLRSFRDKLDSQIKKELPLT